MIRWVLVCVLSVGANSCATTNQVNPVPLAKEVVVQKVEKWDKRLAPILVVTTDRLSMFGVHNVVIASALVNNIVGYKLIQEPMIGAHGVPLTKTIAGTITIDAPTDVEWGQIAILMGDPNVALEGLTTRHIPKHDGVITASKVMVRQPEDHYLAYLVVLHELLHSLGVEHEDNINSVMYPFLVIGTRGELTENVKKQLLDRYGKKPNTCLGEGGSTTTGLNAKREGGRRQSCN